MTGQVRLGIGHHPARLHQKCGRTNLTQIFAAPRLRFPGHSIKFACQIADIATKKSACPGVNPGQASDQQWRRRESNPRPKNFGREHLHAQFPFDIRRCRTQGTGDAAATRPNTSRQRLSRQQAAASLCLWRPVRCPKTKQRGPSLVIRQRVEVQRWQLSVCHQFYELMTARHAALTAMIPVETLTPPFIIYSIL